MGHVANEITNGDDKFACMPTGILTTEVAWGECHNKTNGNHPLKELEKKCSSKWINDKKGCGANQFSRNCEVHCEVGRLIMLSTPESTRVQQTSNELSDFPKIGNNPFRSMIGNKRH